MCVLFQYTIFSSVAFLLVGILMATTGAGGALLALPTFLIFLKVPLPQAIAATSAVVGVAALSTFFDENNRKDFPKSLAARFLIPLLMGSLAGAWLVHWLNSSVLSGLLIGLLMYSGWRAFRTLTKSVESFRPLPLVGPGSAVGLLMGVLGAAGGFLAVPALMRWAGLDRERAISVSLLGVALGAGVSVLLHYQLGVLRIGLVLPAVIAVLIGMEIGAFLRNRIPEKYQIKFVGTLLWGGAVGVAVKIWG